MALVGAVMTQDPAFGKQEIDMDAKVVELDPNPEPITSIEEYNDGLWVQESACTSAIIATCMVVVELFVISFVVSLMPAWANSSMKTSAVLSVSIGCLGQMVLVAVCMFTPKRHFTKVYPLISLLYAGFNFAAAFAVHYFWTMVPATVAAQQRTGSVLYIVLPYGLVMVPWIVLLATTSLLFHCNTDLEEGEGDSKNPKSSYRDAMALFMFTAAVFDIMAMIQSVERLQMITLAVGIAIYGISLLYFLTRYEGNTRGEPLPFFVLDIANTAPPLVVNVAVGLAVLRYLY